jgi:putative ATP-dependent DNA ligase
MNIETVASRLGLTVERFESLKETIIKESTWPSPGLLRFEKAVSGIEGGTVVFPTGEIVYGYPKIKRAMLLAPAIRSNFKGRLAVQEKMNGYNVRVVSIDGDVLALTRGGFICPFSTEVARKRINPLVFERQPELVLCGEMVGPENPYVPKSIYGVDSIDFFLFDVSKKNSRNMMGTDFTRSIAEEYGIRSAPFFGEFDAFDAAREIMLIIRRLGKAHREGVIIKDPEAMVSPIKYTTSQSNCSDLQFAFRFYNDYAMDFFISRVVREGFQSVEWNESDAQRASRAQRLGEAILMPLCKTIEEKMEGVQIVQQAQIRVSSIQTAREFEQHLRRMGMKAIFDVPEPDGDGYLVRIIKLVMSTNDKTQAMIDGQLW